MRNDELSPRWWQSPSCANSRLVSVAEIEECQPDQAELHRRIAFLEARLGEEIALRGRQEERLAEEDKMQALGHLATDITHDFNHVLQAVRSGLSLIERRLTSDSEGLRRITLMMAKAVEQGESVTRRLLSFAHRSEPEIEPVDVLPLLREIHEMLAQTLGNTIAVCVVTEGDLPPALAHKGQLEMVLVNLMVNARDAISAKSNAGGRITLRAARSQVEADQVHEQGLKPGTYVCLSVTDTGSGMDTSTLARAGEPFFTTKPVGKGTGLGLASARRFALSSNGALVIKSVPTLGTTVSLWLPQASAPSMSFKP